MEPTSVPQISQLLDRISYLESLLTANNITFDKYPIANPPKKSQDQHPSPFQTSLSLSKDNPLTVPLIERYSRQMLLSEISFEGQKTLQNAKVLVVGAGGIGAPALYYLAGMGIGTIGIVDGDKVEESNLHRQILHTTKRVGMNKALSAFKTLHKFNPNPNYKVYQDKVTVKNVEDIVKDYDIVLDASDNALTRYLLNDICILRKKTLVSGSALGWEGQLSVFGLKKDSPCYRCLFPICPRNMMSCGEAGVVGMVPGLIGLLQAIETLKILTGVDGVLSQEMIIYDGIRTVFKKVKLRTRQKNCCVCGENPSIQSVESYDYDSFVGSGSCTVFPVMKPENNLKWEEAIEIYSNESQKDKICLIDCRPQSQFNIVNLAPFLNVPTETFRKYEKGQMEDLLKDRKTFVMCRRGNLSRIVVKLLVDNGFKDVYNIEGGITAYGDKGFGDIPKI